MMLDKREKFMDQALAMSEMRLKQFQLLKMLIQNRKR